MREISTSKKAINYIESISFTANYIQCATIFHYHFQGQADLVFA